MPNFYVQYLLSTNHENVECELKTVLTALT